jgi:phosphate transport system substrate-binding protein
MLLTSMAGAVAAWAPARADDPIVLTGSGRMMSLVGDLAEAYRKVHPDERIDIRTDVDGGGLEALEEGKATAVALGRGVTEQERGRMLLVRRVDLVGVPIAMDAVVVFVCRGNPLEALTLDEVAKVFSHHATAWEALGVAREGRFKVHALKEGSGPRGVLQARALRGKALTSTCVVHETTRDAVTGVAGDWRGIGFGATGYSTGVKVVAIKERPDTLPIMATDDTIARREYPLSHYVYLYFPGQPQGPARAFMAFVVSADGQRVVRASEAGFVPLPFVGNSD